MPEGRGVSQSAETTSADAPFRTASGRNRCPSAFAPLIARKSVPGVTFDELFATEEMSGFEAYRCC